VPLIGPGTFAIPLVNQNTVPGNQKGLGSGGQAIAQRIELGPLEAVLFGGCGWPGNLSAKRRHIYGNQAQYYGTEAPESNAVSFNFVQ
jgi:hypothetical protein